jgi:hypothetical protein
MLRHLPSFSTMSRGLAIKDILPIVSHEEMATWLLRSPQFNGATREIKA